MQLHSDTTLTGSSSGSVFQIAGWDRKQPRTVTVTISAGTGTVTIKGRNEPNEAWGTLYTTTATAVQAITLTAQVQVDFTGGTGMTASVDADIYPGTVTV